jgi:hypothetical protein
MKAIPLTPFKNSFLTIATFLGFIGGLLLLQNNAHALQIIEELSPQEVKTIEGGNELIKTIDKPGHTWPEVRVYKTLKASPQTVTDLFLDYENAHTFIGNLKSAVVENSPDPNTKDVRYTVKLPVLFTINYLVRNKYEKSDHGYTIRWNLLESMLAKSATGSLRVEEHPSGSVICYANHVEPATKLVAGLKGQAIKEASATVSAIGKEAERRQQNLN